MALQARLYHRHGSTGTALQARLYRHGSTGAALQARLYRNGCKHGSTQARLYRHDRHAQGNGLNRPVHPNQSPSTRRLRGEYAGIGVSGAGPEARQVDLARLHRHGSTGTALQARLYRHGSTGTALQSRLYRNGSADTFLHRHGSTGTALQASAGQQTQIGRRSKTNP